MTPRRTGCDSRWRQPSRQPRDLRARHRDEVAGLKAENTTLRRKLGETRAALREALSAADEAGRAADELRGQVDAAGASAEKEIRQLRAQVARLEAEARADRRVGRTERRGDEPAGPAAPRHRDRRRDRSAPRARAAARVRGAGRPGGGRVASEGTRRPTSAGSLDPTSAALLEQYLALPRARLIVDGYNVSKTAWPSSSLEAQRTRLLRGLAPLVARTGVEATVVFDAGVLSRRPVVTTPRGVKVRLQPRGRDRRRRDPRPGGGRAGGRVVVVVTSDQEVARDVVRRRGAERGRGGPGRAAGPDLIGARHAGVQPPGGEMSVAAGSVTGMTTRIDCDTCVVRGLACHDCVVTVLLGPPPELAFDDDERRALDVLADGGLVPPLRLVQPVEGPEVESA